MYYTTWGVYFTTVSQFLLFLSSIERVYKLNQIKRNMAKGVAEDDKATSNWLWKATSFTY
jgi:hypothetical protein